VKRAKKGEGVNVSVYMPKELHKRLTKLAAQERRSLHEQIMWMLEKGPSAS
jgi:predicted HicB family RNase H-like nuclease